MRGYGREGWEVGLCRKVRLLCHCVYILTADVTDGQTASSQKKASDPFQRNTRASRVSCTS